MTPFESFKAAVDQNAESKQLKTLWLALEGSARDEATQLLKAKGIDSSGWGRRKSKNSNAPYTATVPEPVVAVTTSSPTLTGLAWWLQAFKVELMLFGIVFVALMMFSAQRFWRQSAAPHFVYQSKAWLEGRIDLDFDTLPNLEDWACVREVNGVKTRCEGQPQRTDRWYSSFPPFPSVVMLPFVLVNGYQLNDTSFGVIVGALAIALFYSLLRLLQEHEGSERTLGDNVGLSLLLAFGTVFFYSSLRGEVWFGAQIMGVALTALYLRNSVRARRPVLAGLFWSMAVLTRTPLFFTGLFFVFEAVAPDKGERWQQFKQVFKNEKAKRALLQFGLAAAPLGLIAAVMNHLRFGSPTEFGHRFLFNNRVNRDIDTFGLFHPHYLERNLDAAFEKLPVLLNGRLSYTPWGLSLFLTLPFLALAFVPATQPKRVWGALAAMAAVLVGSALFPAAEAIGQRPTAQLLLLAGTLTLLGFFAHQWVKEAAAPRLLVPVLATLVACAGPGLLYQNTGYAQFGFRFSIDYTPYVMVLVALGGWSLRRPMVVGIAAVALIVNFWGAVAFRGYTEQVRGWL